MAMIDYGAIAFKNGTLISTGMFTPMKDMVGWEDTKNDLYSYRYHTIDEPKENYMLPIKLKGNYFAYIGDSDCTIAFYKEQLVIAEKNSDNTFDYHHEYFNCSNYTWSKWSKYAGVSLSDISKVYVYKKNGYLVCKWNYKGDKYKVYFGYGVDLPYYKKWHIVNYYRSPHHILWKIKNWFKDKFFEMGL